MLLQKARVQKYRSVRDTGWFDIESAKTIMVGANEAGKTAILQALQQINPPKGTRKLDPLRDYPRSEYNDITVGKIEPHNVTIVEGHFMLEDCDKAAVPEAYRNCCYVVKRRYDNEARHHLVGAPPVPNYASISKDLNRLSAHMDARMAPLVEGAKQLPAPSEQLASIAEAWSASLPLTSETATALRKWLEKNIALIDEANEIEQKRYDSLIEVCELPDLSNNVLNILWNRLPVFVLFSNYFRVRPLIHLEHLAHRIEHNSLDDESYDYGNKCLLQLLGFSARELSNLGNAAEPAIGKVEALKTYQDQLDKRSYQLNAASVRLSGCDAQPMYQSDAGLN